MIFKTFSNSIRIAVRLTGVGLCALALASCGGGGGSGGTVPGTPPPTVAASVASMQILFSSPTLPSAGNTSSNVTVTALVEDANNNAMSGVPVTFAANSGILAVTQATSDSSGHATATLGTNGNPTDRTITVTATAGSVSATGTVAVTGTTITPSNAPSTLTYNTLNKFSFVVQDSGGNNIPNAAVTFSSAAGNKIVVDPSDAGTSAAPVTNASGTVTLDVTPTVIGADTITVTAEGATGSVSFTTTSQSLTVTLSDNTTSPPTVVSVSPQPLNEYTRTSCVQINATYQVSGAAPPAGTAAYVATSRGTLYTDNACTVPFTAVSVPFNAAGAMQSLYLNSVTAGTATVTVNETNGGVNGPSQTAAVTFIAQLIAGVTPSITLNASPSVVLPNTNSANPQAQFSTLVATVRDGSPNNNLVQGVPVQFSLVTDSSGGTISPSVVYTQANGQAQANYYPGGIATAANGVVVKASIESSVATNSTTFPLTVTGPSLFVTLGTGNTMTELDSTTYQMPWSVYVTDSAGQPVVNAAVSGSLVASSYTKGQMVLVTVESGGASLNATPTYEWEVVPGPNPLVLQNPSLPASSTNPYVQQNPPIASNTPTDGFTSSGAVSSNSVNNYWCPNTDPTNDGVWSANNPIQIHYPNPLPPNAPYGAVAGAVYPYVMPGIPGNVSPASGATVNATGQPLTDVNGHTTLMVTYPKNHAYWTNVVLTATAFVGGTQASTSVFFALVGLTGDYTNPAQSPPGQVSPYGINNCETAF